MAGRAAQTQPAPPSTGAQDLGWLLGTLLRSYLKGAADAVRELPGGPRGYQVLSIASAGACRNQAGIADSLGVDRTVMTYLLDDLERAKLIERKPDPTDRRSRQILLTAKGVRRLAQLTERIAAVEQSLLADLTEAEGRQLRELLARATSAAGPDPAGESLCDLAVDPALSV
jgi:DNA-binding MarR family transcriptional regulator